MKKLLLSTTCLMLLIFWPIQAQEIAPVAPPEARVAVPERFTTISETNFLNNLAIRGLKLDAQGVFIESLDGNTVFAELNSKSPFNPASVIKVATSFAAMFKLGPEYHFETAFYSDGSVNKATKTLNGDLILSTTGDPALTSTDLTRLIRQVVASGISRVSGNLVVTGPFTYNSLMTTELASRRMEALVRRMGIRVSGSSRKGPVRGTKIASHLSSSLRDIVFQQNAHSINQTADRLGEVLGGPDAVERFLVQEVGLRPSDITITHTSGLDYNRITPRATVALMRHMVGFLNLHNMLLEDVLPVAGIDPGTLHSRFTSFDSRGAVVAKTGTLPGTDGGVSTLAGIIYTQERGPILFAIFNTRGNVNTYRRIQDNLLRDLLTECGGSQLTSVSSRRSNNNEF